MWERQTQTDFQDMLSMQHGKASGRVRLHWISIMLQMCREEWVGRYYVKEFILFCRLTERSWLFIGNLMG